MATYITALQPWGRVDTSNFVNNTEASDQAYAKHAVQWPDPASRDWSALRTACDKSTQEWKMRRAAQEPTVEWIPADVPGTTCSTCQRETRTA